MAEKRTNGTVAAAIDEDSPEVIARRAELQMAAEVETVAKIGAEARARRRVLRDAQRLRLDEVQPGGAYRGTDGSLHDAHGRPVSAIPRSEWTAAQAREAAALAEASEAEIRVLQAEQKAARARAAAAKLERATDDAKRAEAEAAARAE